MPKEGTTHVNEYKIEWLAHDYKLFKMQDEESIEKYFH